MPTRFICPHCHHAIDPDAMESAFSDLAEYRICPNCDEAVFHSVRENVPLPAWLRRNAQPAAAAPSAH
ncbi:MAG: hypothetical protein ACK4KV_12240 [Rhodocyclaceae bacterium]